MYIILAGKYPPNPAELLNGKMFSALISACRSSFDYVIIDTPPLGAVIDAAVIAPNCDGMALVVGKPKLNYTVATEVVEQLKKSGTPLLGVIRNIAASSGKKKSYYYSKDKSGAATR